MRPTSTSLFFWSRDGRRRSHGYSIQVECLHSEHLPSQNSCNYQQEERRKIISKCAYASLLNRSRKQTTPCIVQNNKSDLNAENWTLGAKLCSKSRSGGYRINSYPVLDASIMGRNNIPLLKRPLYMPTARRP